MVLVHQLMLELYTETSDDESGPPTKRKICHSRASSIGETIFKEIREEVVGVEEDVVDVVIMGVAMVVVVMVVVVVVVVVVREVAAVVGVVVAGVGMVVTVAGTLWAILLVPAVPLGQAMKSLVSYLSIILLHCGVSCTHFSVHSIVATGDAFSGKL